MSETIKEVNDIDKLFSEIVINGETYKSENYVPETVKPAVIVTTEQKETTREDTKPKAEPTVVSREIEDLSAMFASIEVNGEVYESDKYVPPVPETKVIKAAPAVTDTPSSTTQSKAQPSVGQPVNAVNLNGTLHDFEDIEAIQKADSAKRTANTANQGVEEIKTLVPDQATAENKLADKDFVNSSIATNTANFIGTFNTLEELESQTATNNDYAFWRTTDSLGSVVFKRYKYVADDGTWQYEYDLNNSSFTEEQWKAINSGITEEIVARIGEGNVKTVNNIEPDENKNVQTDVEISAEDYSEMESQGLVDPNKNYFVPDGFPQDIKIIDDSVVQEETTWSSEKIQNENGLLNDKIEPLSQWIDISDKVTLTATSSSGSYTINKKKFYLCGNFLKVDLNVIFNYATTSGSNPLKLRMTSSLFNTGESLSCTYYSSYYGAYIWTVGFNVYEGETNIFTFRPNYSFGSGVDASFSGIIPINRV